MIFNSIVFLYFFLLLFICLYYLINSDLRKILLIILSFIFYGFASISNLVLMLFIILVNYLSIFFITIKLKEKNRLPFVILIVLFNLIFLAFYKYHSFLPIFSKYFDGTISYLVVPLGISFFTFSNVSFIVDIYNDKAKLCSLADYVCYISIFTKVISGPIMRYCDFYNQIGELYNLDVNNIATGIERFIIGLAKKVIIADILGLTVQSIFNQIGLGMDMPTAWLGAICYTFQIYYDFSGYSDMAIGLSKIFGLNIKENFNFPYQSKSITEFWRRWHISLGEWFKNYVYIPLGGNRKGNIYVNLFVVFFLTGLWHGATLNFLVWGCVFGIIMIVERHLFEKNWYKKIPDIIKWFATFNIVNFLWVIFRCNNVIYGFKYIAIMLGIYHTETMNFISPYYLKNSVVITLLVAIAGALAINCSTVKLFYLKFEKRLLFNILKGIFLLLLFVVTLVYVTNSSFSPNIYFQF